MEHLRKALPPVAIFALAFTVRLVFLFHIEAYPKFERIRNRLDDQVVFDYWAKSIVRGETPDFSSTGHEYKGVCRPVTRGLVDNLPRAAPGPPSARGL
jgi:hypothetical protein